MSQRARIAVLLACLLVVVAGCNGIDDESAAPDRENFGVSDQLESSLDGVIDDDDAAVLVPGLTTDGIVNGIVLEQAHRNALGERPYTLHSKYIRNESEPVRIEQEVRRDPQSQHIYAIQHRLDGRSASSLPPDDVPLESIDGVETTEFWSDGNATIRRTTLPNGSVEYQRGPPGTITVTQQRVSRLRDATESTVERTDDGRYYVVNEHGNRTADLPEDVSNGVYPLEATTTVYVREDGFVPQSTSQQTVLIDGERITETRTRIVERVGETIVEPPAWYEEALEATSGQVTQRIR